MIQNEITGNPTSLPTDFGGKLRFILSVLFPQRLRSTAAAHIFGARSNYFVIMGAGGGRWDVLYLGTTFLWSEITGTQIENRNASEKVLSGYWASFLKIMVMSKIPVFFFKNFSLGLCFVVDFGIHKICFWWTFSLPLTFCTSPCNQCPDELSF
jgi:hypothetical protein